MKKLVAGHKSLPQDPHDSAASGQRREYVSDRSKPVVAHKPI